MFDHPLTRFLRLSGRTLALAWAGFWIAAGLWTGLNRGEGVVRAAEFGLFPGGLFLFLVVLVWRWEKVGAWALLLTGLLIVTHVSRAAEAGASWVLLAGPPLLGGILLLMYHRLEAAPVES